MPPCGKNATAIPQLNVSQFFLPFQRLLLNSQERYNIYIAGGCLHFVGLILVATTVFMFVRYKVLRRSSHLVHLNLLFSDTALLLTDWAAVSATAAGCDVYSISFLVFGSSSVYTAVAIAYGRYEHMKNRSGRTNSLTKHPLAWIIGIWVASVMASVFPLYSKAQIAFTSHTAFSGHMCFYVDGILYKSQRHSIAFILLVVVIPVTIMTFCYVRIYQNVRRARISRWINQAAHQYSTHTRIIYGHKRRANIVPRKQQSSQYPLQSNTISHREKHIVIKGLVSVVPQLLFWLPFGISWLSHSHTGFPEDFRVHQVYIMILAKCSVVVNICHYISFNVKFRKFYINPLTKCCSTDSAGSPRVEISHISHAETSIRRRVSLTSACTELSDKTNPSVILPLRPIMETEITESLTKVSDGRQSGLSRERVRSVSTPARLFLAKRNTIFPALDPKRDTV